MGIEQFRVAGDELIIEPPVADQGLEESADHIGPEIGRKIVEHIIIGTPFGNLSGSGKL